ncbi:MAG: histidinol-phosphate transaminase [Lachnospiraceae bacterium]|nr:histidinol-phosphate transaminase [Lachnospiraceae bacterium]
MGTWRDNVRRVTPYVPGEQPQRPVIKLNTNENPYPPSPAVLAILREMSGKPEAGNRCEAANLRKYPDAEVTELVNAISEVYGFDPAQIFVGVGSDDVLGMVFLTFFSGNAPILFPDVTYSFYDVWAELYRIPYKQIPLDENFRIRTEDYTNHDGPIGGIIIANPNAPTSVSLPLSEVRKILDANRDVAVVVDEAYVDFGGESALPLLAEYDNLLVVQTYSKSRSLAGSRIGFAIGSAEMIKALSDIKYSYNSYTMDSLTIRIGAASMRDTDYWKATCAKIVATREAYRPKLEELGFTVLPSTTNFYFATHKSVPAETIFTELKKRDIFVRFWNKPRINNHLRITIGTDAEMDALIAALKEILAAFG